MLDPSRSDEPAALDVVVGIPAVLPGGAARAAEAALAVEAELREAFPGRVGLAVVLSPDGGLPAPPGTQVVSTGGRGGPDAALPALLELANQRDAPACALLEPLPRRRGSGWLRSVLAPVLEQGFDLVAPSYTRGRLEGVLVTGVVYPLTRALFGVRLRQPLGREIVLSGRLAEHLLSATDWRTDPAHAGADLWVITKALVGDAKVAQVFLGPRPIPPDQPADASSAVTGVLGLMFHEMDRHAAYWQHTLGSRPVATFGEGRPASEPVGAPAPGPLVEAFALGWQDLRELWGMVLPPQSLLALKRLPRDRPEAFRMPDALWARIIYDFAVGWRLKTMERSQLLRSLTPIYLGWLAGYTNEVGPLGPEQAEARVEAICSAFEAEKRYLITRWRWPDRFSP